MTFRFRYKNNILTGLLQFATALLFCVSAIPPGNALHARNADFLGVAIYRLAEHISWPDAKNIKQYRIHIIDDNDEIESVLKRIATSRKLHDRPIYVSQSSNTVIPKQTQVIFLAKHKSASLKNILKQTENTPTLIISYATSEQRNVMINFVKAEDSNKIRFEINKANIINRNMQIDPTIILLGGTEIDVARLYREAQSKLLENEKKVKSIENKILEISKEKDLLDQVLSRLSVTVEQQRKNYANLERETKAQEKEIQKQIKELRKRERHLKRQQKEIDKRRAILADQQTKIKTLATTISNQDTIIKNQTETLSRSSKQIETQQSYLLLLSVLITLAIASALITYFLYRKYHYVNRELKQSLIKTERYANRVEIANEQLKSFSYTVSHDLRAPLRSISGFSQILFEDFSDELNNEAKEYLERIVKNVNKMDNLITDILQLSKISQTDLKVEDNVNLSDIVSDELKQLNNITPRAPMKLKIQPNVLCKCDPALIQIVIANIVSNAWKYTPTTQPAEFEFGQTKKDNKVIYYFKDNGVGFNMEFSKKLFEPFQRLHSAKEFEGTGVGLATVKRVINLHHGEIWAESEVNKGTTFYFTLYTH